MLSLERLQSAGQCSPSWKLSHILGKKRIQNVVSWLLWICAPPAELSKGVQASLNLTNVVSWSIKGLGVNFMKCDGEEQKPVLVNRYYYLNTNSSNWTEKRWKLLRGKRNLKQSNTLAGARWIILQWQVTNICDEDRNTWEDPTQMPFQSFFILLFFSFVQCSLSLSGPWH